MKIKNKQKKQLIIAIPAVLIIIFFTYLLMSTSENLSSRHWERVSIEEITKENYKIDYIFWSDCGACYNLTQALNEYLAGKNFITLNKTPSTGGGWTGDARLYHAIEEITNDNKMHTRNTYNAYVNQIHSRNNPIRSENAKIQFLADRLNVSHEQFESILYSPEIEERLQISQSINNKLGVRSVPQLFINGEYKLNMQSFSNYQDIFNEIENIFKEH